MVPDGNHALRWSVVRFGLNNRFGLFPSFSAAWNLSERPWFDEKDWIDFFKVRGSWGRNGNAEIGDYAYNPIIVNGLNYTFGNEQVQTIGSGPVAIANPDKKWETGEQINLGVDADFLDQYGWNLIFDIYEKNTIDMLAYVPNPGTAGLEPEAIQRGLRTQPRSRIGHWIQRGTRGLHVRPQWKHLHVSQ